MMQGQIVVPKSALAEPPFEKKTFNSRQVSYPITLTQILLPQKGMTPFFVY